MTDKKRGLGRGLGALIPSGPRSTADDSPVVSVGPLHSLRPAPTPGAPEPVASAPTTPRSRSTPSRRTPDSRGRCSRRRRWPSWCSPCARSDCCNRSWFALSAAAASSWWRASGVGAQRRGRFETIPAIIRDTSDDALLRDSLLENLHRAQLNPLEEAAAYGQLLSRLRLHAGRAGRAHRSFTAAGVQHAAAVAAATIGAASGRRGCALGGPCAGAAVARLTGDQEKLGRHDRRRGSVGRGVEELVALGEIGDDEKPGRRRQVRTATPRWQIWPRRSPTSWRPASPSTSVRPRDESPSRSHLSTTSNASCARSLRRQPVPFVVRLR